MTKHQLLAEALRSAITLHEEILAATGPTPDPFKARKRHPDLFACIDAALEGLWKTLVEDFGTDPLPQSEFVQVKRAMTARSNEDLGLPADMPPPSDPAWANYVSGMADTVLAVLVGKMVLSYYKMPASTDTQPSFAKYADRYRASVAAVSSSEMSQ